MQNEFSENTIDYNKWAKYMGIWCLISTLSKIFNYITLNVFIDFFNKFGGDILDILKIIQN